MKIKYNHILHNMPQEFEYAFFNFTKKDIISKTKELNGTYIRVRDEGFRTTITYKY